MKNVPLTDNARTVFMQRYALKNDNREPIETPEQTMWRVANTVAGRGKSDINYGEVFLAEVFFHNLLVPLNFLPNSPTFTGAGTPLGQLAACFVLPIEDDMGAHPDGIFSTLKNAALIQKTGGGNGFSFSRLRPKGALIESSKGYATGPVGFLRVFNAAFKEVSQGGARRGANMAVLRVDHPDIEEFIECKSKEGDIDNFNISVGITDAFMEAVRDDKDFSLVFNGKVYKTVRAKDLMKKIAFYAHKNGEPGVLFLDAANRRNPVPHLYELEATNPCGEQYLGPYENCCLGSINLKNHLIKSEGFRSRYFIDWDKLEETVELSTKFLDCVVDANAYVEAVPQLREAALDVRRIGLGIMGFADVLYKMGIRYGSDEAQDLAKQVMAFIRYHSIKTSIELAENYGPFRKFDGSIYDTKKLHVMLAPFSVDNLGEKIYYDFKDLQADLNEYGIRNGAQLTIAPTGTISSVAGVEGYGCEPAFALGYTRHMVGKNGEDIELEYLSPAFLETLDESLADSLITQDEYNLLKTTALQTGTIANVQNTTNNLSIARMQETFVTAMDISWASHIKMQAAFQLYVDNSLSKTINMPNIADWQDVQQAYMQAWETGCKGLTVYREGSREQVVLETKAEKERKQSEGNKEVFAEMAIQAPPTKQLRAQVLPGKTYKQTTPAGTAYVTVNEEDGEPFEVFITLGKGGSEVNAICEAIGRNISLLLRMASPVPRSVRLQWIMDELSGIGGGRNVGFGINRVTSVPDGVAKVLRRYLNEDALVPSLNKEPEPYGLQGDICPECGNSTLIDIEGCRKCIACGYSEC